MLETTPLWDLQKSEMSLIVGDESFRQSTIALTPGQSEVRFGRICEVGHPLYATAKPPGATLIVKYPEAPLVRLRLEPQPESSGGTSTLSSLPVVDFLTSASFKTRPQKLVLVSVQIGEIEFPLSGRGPEADAHADGRRRRTDLFAPDARFPIRRQAGNDHGNSGVRARHTSNGIGPSSGRRSRSSRAPAGPAEIAR